MPIFFAVIRGGRSASVLAVAYSQRATRSLKSTVRKRADFIIAVIIVPYLRHIVQYTTFFLKLQGLFEKNILK